MSQMSASSATLTAFFDNQNDAHCQDSTEAASKAPWTAPPLLGGRRRSASLAGRAVEARRWTVAWWRLTVARRGRVALRARRRIALALGVLWLSLGVLRLSPGRIAGWRWVALAVRVLRRSGRRILRHSVSL